MSMKPIRVLGGRHCSLGSCGRLRAGLRILAALCEFFMAALLTRMRGWGFLSNAVAYPAFVTRRAESIPTGIFAFCQETLSAPTPPSQPRK